MSEENIEIEILEVEEPVVHEEEPVEEHVVHEEEMVEDPIVHEEEMVEEHVVHEEEMVEEPVVHEEEMVEEHVVHEEEIVEEHVVHEEPVEEPVVHEEEIEAHVEYEVIDEPVVHEEEPVVIETKVIPKMAFIIPYRDRKEHQAFYSNHMKNILEDYNKTDYEIYYIHQCDTRDFNRGAMKNIGFLTIKEKYPDNYKNITLVFNDVDIMPKTKGLFDYDTTMGNIKHFYGFNFTLGGLFSIKGGDYEKIGGFPNFWSWGYEDNLLQLRALAAGLNIDLSQFYPIMDSNIIHLNDGLIRTINKSEFDKYVGNTSEGWHSITNVSKEFDESTGFVNIFKFDAGSEPNSSENKTYDLRNGSAPFRPNTFFKSSRRSRAKMGMGL
jgi:hypothetical protein